MNQPRPFQQPAQPQVPQPTIPIVSAGAPVEPGLPCPTLHVSNLNERIHPRHLIPELRTIFSSLNGTILSITCKRRLNLRGQAFVVFSQQADATKVLQALQGRTIYGRTMVIRYARCKSNVTIRREGGKERLMEERATRRATKLERSKYPRLTKRQRLAQALAAGSLPIPIMNVPGSMANAAMQMATLELPNKTVFVQGLPGDATDAELDQLFRRYIGFVEVRRIPNQQEIAFVEYETEPQAGVVRNALDRHEMRPARPIRVTFARR